MASLYASGSLAYVLLGTSRQQRWTSPVSDVGVNPPSVRPPDTDENAPLVASDRTNCHTYAAVGSVA